MTRCLSILSLMLVIRAAAAQSPTSRAADALPAPVFVSAPRIVVTPQIEPGTPADRVELWASRDGRRSWRLVATTNDIRRVHYDAPEDGRYELFVRLINGAGASAAEPQAGTIPTATLVVDTIPPVLQLHEAGRTNESGDSPEIRLRLSHFDENLGPAGVRLFYRATGATLWRDGGTLQPAEDRAEWQPPGDARGALDLRIVAADRAGNVAGDELRGVLATAARPALTTRPAPASSATQAVIDSNGSPRLPLQPSDDVLVPAAPSSDVRLQSRVVLVAEQSPTTAQAQNPDYARVEQLRGLAERHLRAGEHALAAARLDDALRAAPADLDTLVQYAGVLTANGDLAGAARRYGDAHHVAPRDPRVLDGLAAVAAAQGDFTAARQHLLTLLEVTPEAGSAWLHYGDVEHRLGRHSEAVTAWRRARESGADADTRAGAARRLELLGPSRAP